MLLTLNLKDRKPLVKAISEFIGEDAVYMKVPTYAYKIGDYTVTKEGNLDVPNNLLPDDLHALYEMLSGKGFGPLEFEVNATLSDEDIIDEAVDSIRTEGDQHNENGEETDENQDVETPPANASSELPLIISLPSDKVNLKNLNALLTSKGELIKKALGADSLSIEVDEDEGVVSFPWFTANTDSDAIKAYSHFIAAICEMSVTQKRISSKEKAVENEKYEFRGLLLRLGFIGEEFKAERKILLKNLSGNSAWPNGAPQK